MLYSFKGAEGLKNLEMRLIPIPSVIFLDINMPGINGRQFLMAMKKIPSSRTSVP
jgi:CheY-like chemotaxis protein